MCVVKYGAVFAKILALTTLRHFIHHIRRPVQEAAVIFKLEELVNGRWDIVPCRV